MSIKEREMSMNGSCAVGRDGLSFFHLSVFESMIRLRSVTLAADELGLPQSSLSRNLQLLRDHFKDPLFVRTKEGMVPTSVAASLVGGVNEALNLYRFSLSQRREFDAASSDRDFRVASSDLGQIYMMPLLYKYSKQAAPNITLTAMPIRRAGLISQLETGEADVAIGSYPRLYANAKEQTLFTEDYVSLVPESAAPDGRITLDRFKHLQHILIDGHIYGHGHEDVARSLLDAIGNASVKMVTQNFMIGALLSESTELALTVPRTVAMLQRSPKMVIVKPPVELPSICIKQYWHERFDHDPGNMWLRKIMAECRRDHAVDFARELVVDRHEMSCAA